MSIVIELAGTPVAKGRPRFSRRTGTAYTPEKTRSYEAQLKFAAESVMQGRPPLQGALRVEVQAMMPVPASWSKKKTTAALTGEIRPTVRPDWENLAKTLDALNQVVWRDDAQIVTGEIRKAYSDRPRLIVKVEALT